MSLNLSRILLSIKNNYSVCSYICVTLIACVFISLSILKLEYIDWDDAVYYAATGKSMILSGHFLLVIPYDEFMSTMGQSLKAIPFNHPNYGFELLLGLTGLIANKFSLFNGVLISALFSVGFSIVLYQLCMRLLSNRVMSILVVLVVNINASVFDIMARPLADMGLMFFLVCTVFSIVIQKNVLAGVILACGYFYREHAIIFLPFLPILSPSCNSIKDYFKLLFVIIIPFSLGPLALKIAELFFLHGYSSHNYYADYFLGGSKSIGVLHLKRFISNMKSYFYALGFPLTLFSALFFICFIKVSARIKRFFIVSVFFACVPCILFMFDFYAPTRYLVYSIPLLWVAVAVFIKDNTSSNKIFIAISLICIALNWSVVVGPTTLKYFECPYNFLEKRYNETQVAVQILQNEIIADKPVIIGYSGFPELAFDKYISLSTPTYEEFYNGAYNHLIDGIILRLNTAEDWPKTDDFFDRHGVHFKKFGSGPSFLFQNYLFYKRIPDNAE